jgi:hypothetical protein
MRSFAASELTLGKVSNSRSKVKIIIFMIITFFGHDLMIDKLSNNVLKIILNIHEFIPKLSVLD